MRKDHLAEIHCKFIIVGGRFSEMVKDSGGCYQKTTRGDRRRFLTPNPRCNEK